MGARGQVQLNLLKDINTYQENPTPDYLHLAYTPSPIATVGTTTFFAATEGATGTELWKTSGSAQTASLVKDLTPGAGSSNISLLTATDTRLFFILNTFQLWTSDGTESGTFLLKDFGDRAPDHLIAVNATLFFLGRTADSGQEMWKSDGTVAGTVMVKDLNPGTGGGALHHMLKINSTLYFSGIYQSSMPELWKTDGTSAGTIKIRTAANASLVNPQDLVNANGILYCTASGGLFKTDGTPNGTVKIDIPLAGGYPKMYSLTAVDGGVYFIANQYPYDPGLTNQLWYVAPGQAAATLAKDLYPIDGTPEPDNFTAYKGKLYFTSWDSQNGYELWKSDGTPAGTTIVKDLAAGVTNGILVKGSQPFIPPFFTVAGNYLYFISNQDDFLLTRTDGTSAGTEVVADLGDHVLYSGLSPGSGETLYFIVNDYVHGAALWKTQGTAGSTIMIKDLIETHATTYISPVEVTRERIFYKGYYYFSAHDGPHGKELWRTDGTTNNTTLVKDISPGVASSSPRYLMIFKNALYFIASDQAHSEEIWKSDGTEAGTVRISDVSINADPQTYLSRLDTLTDKIIFTVITPHTSGHSQLWASDGNPAGTIPISSLTDRVDFNDPLMRVNGQALLKVTTAHNGIELWKTDGTVAGTAMVKDINPGTGSSDPRYHYDLNGIIYFAAYEPNTGVELYRTDGTTAGTYLVKDICPGNCSSLLPLLGFSPVQDRLYFTGYRSTESYSVFRSDGTSNGTVPLHTPIPSYNGYGAPVGYHYVNGKIIYLFINKSDMSGNALWAMDEATFSAQTIASTSSRSSYADNLRVFNNTFYFINTNSVTGGEIWKTDGSPSGTTLLKDVNKGPGSSQAKKFKILRNAIYFTATDGAGDYQLWKSDGICGTRKILNATGEIKDYFVVGSRMILYIDDPIWGDEFFYYNLNEEPALTCPALQAITFIDPVEKKIGDAPFDLTVTASSGLPITLISSDPTVASINGNQVTILKAGQVSITAYQNGNDDYVAATPVTKTLIIQRLPQTIAFPDFANRSEDSAPFLASVSSSSGLPVSLSTSNPSIATVNGLEITVHAKGQVIITANQPGDNVYLAAPPVSKTLLVEAAPEQRLNQVIVFQDMQNRPEQSDPFLAVVSASSGLPVLLSTSDASIATVDGLEISVHQQGQVIITATQPGNDIYLPATPVSKILIVDPVLAAEYGTTSIHVYPNPATGVVIIDSDVVVTEIYLNDVFGRPVEFKKMDNNSIDITALQRGIYFLNLRNASKSFVVKLCKE